MKKCQNIVSNVYYVIVCSQYRQNGIQFIKILLQSTTCGQKTNKKRVLLCVGIVNNIQISKSRKLDVTYGDGSSGLQSELVGKLVDDGGGTAYLSLHLPVAQRLVLYERNGRRDGGWDKKN